MQCNKNMKYTFSGHESFPCKNGYDFMTTRRNFNSPDAVVQLGA